MVIVTTPGLFDGLTDEVVSIITTPMAAGTVIVVTLICPIIFLVKKSRKLPTESWRDEQDENERIDERIERHLELTAFENQHAE